MTVALLISLATVPVSIGSIIIAVRCWRSAGDALDAIRTGRRSNG